MKHFWFDQKKEENMQNWFKGKNILSTFKYCHGIPCKKRYQRGNQKP